MGDIHYMISEASKDVGVEAHVLRYWEEELELPIGRTEMGHRYYTKEDMRLFSCINQLKDTGINMKELKVIMPEIREAREVRMKKLSVEKKEQQDVETNKHIDIDLGQVHMAVVMERVLQNNNVILEQGINEMVTESMKREISTLLLAKDRIEEDRYTRLDALIRQYQVDRKESGKKAFGIGIKELLGFAG